MWTLNTLNFFGKNIWIIICNRFHQSKVDVCIRSIFNQTTHKIEKKKIHRHESNCLTHIKNMKGEIFLIKTRWIYQTIRSNIFYLWLWLRLIWHWLFTFGVFVMRYEIRTIFIIFCVVFTEKCVFVNLIWFEMLEVLFRWTWVEIIHIIWVFVATYRVNWIPLTIYLYPCSKIQYSALYFLQTHQQYNAWLAICHVIRYWIS